MTGDIGLPRLLSGTVEASISFGESKRIANMHFLVYQELAAFRRCDQISQY
jgi:hypothetical protein